MPRGSSPRHVIGESTASSHLRPSQQLRWRSPPSAWCAPPMMSERQLREDPDAIRGPGSRGRALERVAAPDRRPRCIAWSVRGRISVAATASRDVAQRQTESRLRTGSPGPHHSSLPTTAPRLRPQYWTTQLLQPTVVLSSGRLHTSLRRAVSGGRTGASSRKAEALVVGVGPRQDHLQRHLDDGRFGPPRWRLAID